MLIARVRPRLVAGDQAVVDMPPMIGSGVGWIDAERFDGVDRLQHTFNLRPAGQAQENFAARAHEGHGRERLAGMDGAQNVDARDDGAEIVRGPADVGDDACLLYTSRCV